MALRSAIELNDVEMGRLLVAHGAYLDCVCVGPDEDDEEGEADEVDEQEVL